MDSEQAAYRFRLAEPRDAETIAWHRACIMQDMGVLLETEVAEFVRASIPWLERLLRDQEYVGWFAVCGNEVVAGGGIHVREMGPGVGCLRMGRWGHIVSMYTVPEHRRRGLARRVMELILEWTEAEKLDRVTLTATKEGEPLYVALGFSHTPDMLLAKKR